MTKFKAGFAEIEWTPAPGLNLLGQMHERIATHARDPLCTCAAVFQNEAATVAIVTLDVGLLSNEFAEGVQRLWSEATRLPPGSLLVHCTHTHVAPVAVPGPLGDPAPGMTEKLQRTVLDAATAALNKCEPVELFAACGELEHMGWNRRVMFSDGSSAMYGDSKRADYIGLEGPRDGVLPLIWAKNAEGKITGIVTGFATHPNTMESECFYSADLPGAARKYLRRFFGAETGAVYLTGCAGNTAPSQLDPSNPMGDWRNDAGCERSGQYIAGEAARLIAATDKPMASGELRVETKELSIPLRPWPEEGEPGRPQPRAWAPAVVYYDKACESWPRRLEEVSPLPVKVNVVRLGDAAICTNPAELFVEFGLEIRESSPAAVTLCAELTDGYCGYVPTPKAFSRGGYETWCAPTSQLPQEAGDEIVAATKELLGAVFE